MTKTYSEAVKLRLAVVSFTTCSSTMLIVNKIAISAFPAPGTLLLFQLTCSSASIIALAAFRVVKLQKLEWNNIQPYTLVSFAFLGALYTNIKTLQYANIETFIVFRASTPLLISVLDFVFLGRALPSARSATCLIGLVLGSVAYVWTDSQFQVLAYKWVISWYLVFCFDQIFIKYIVDTIELSTWDRSLYTNFMAILPVLLVGLMRNEHTLFVQHPWTVSHIAAVGASSLLGVCMSISSFYLRSMVSATYFTLVGTICKILSVFINYFVWDNHATTTGLVCLSLCLVCASWYEQAPLRSGVKN